MGFSGNRAGSGGASQAQPGRSTVTGFVRAWLDITLNQLLNSDYYRDATDEEIVDYIVRMSPSNVR